MKPDGDRAESLAAAFLERRGLRIEERNYRCRQGEVDLVCRDGVTLVFVEVRLRRNSGFGGAAESITRRKQQRILLAAQHYLTRLDKLPPCRFDAVLLRATDCQQIEWIRDAFTA